jgi:hypothetical protein
LPAVSTLRLAKRADKECDAEAKYKNDGEKHIRLNSQYFNGHRVIFVVAGIASKYRQSQTDLEAFDPI